MNHPILAVLQRIGRSLMLPIAVLPAAGLLLRFGQDDMLGSGDTGLHLASRLGWDWVQNVANVFSAAGGALFTAGRTAPRRWPRWSATWSSSR
jgi:PTS system N-acetylglucosamine-specific IIC component